jgi:hypothetical protein
MFRLMLQWCKEVEEEESNLRPIKPKIVLCVQGKGVFVRVVVVMKEIRVLWAGKKTRSDAAEPCRLPRISAPDCSIVVPGHLESLRAHRL